MSLPGGRVTTAKMMGGKKTRSPTERIKTAQKKEIKEARMSTDKAADRRGGGPSQGGTGARAGDGGSGRV